jgi:hypothetical protein
MPRASRRFVRILRAGLGCIFLLACLAGGAWGFARHMSERQRTQWKAEAVERLVRLSNTDDEVRRELDELQASGTSHPELGWAHDHVLLMTNGEYITYEYRHGANGYFPPHLFLGRCSDGRWLYSSYHFCNSMIMVRLDDPPGSIAEFAERYSACEFDGKSDECLRMTE